MANEYATLAEAKSALNLNDTNDDAALTLALESASRMIDDHCNRRFWQDAVAVTRLYRFESTGRVVTDDISTTAGLVVTVDQNGDGAFEDAWVLGTDYALYPLNALAEGRPVTFLGSRGTKTAPTRPGSVQVAARFGWPAVPPAIRQAALIQALRLVNRRHSPYGIAGSPEAGSEMRLLSRLDPDVEALVRPYVKHWCAQ
jgi:hypothetical protein